MSEHIADSFIPIARAPMAWLPLVPLLLFCLWRVGAALKVATADDADLPNHVCLEAHQRLQRDCGFQCLEVRRRSALHHNREVHALSMFHPESKVLEQLCGTSALDSNSTDLFAEPCFNHNQRSGVVFDR